MEQYDRLGSSFKSCDEIPNPNLKTLKVGVDSDGFDINEISWHLKDGSNLQTLTWSR